MFEEKLIKYSEEIRDLFSRLNDLVFAAVPTVQTKLWAGLPSYYVGEKFVRLIPFKDHLNIEAAALINHKAQLSNYKFTPKNMLQINIGQSISYEILTKVFAETLVV
ncbi:MAG: DUF1801 domain-containing protein [Clostridiales bacterium]|nr:DUF1801 domain-containing protein [Clostridiales bacterium]